MLEVCVLCMGVVLVCVVGVGDVGSQWWYCHRYEVYGIVHVGRGGGGRHLIAWYHCANVLT